MSQVTAQGSESTALCLLFFFKHAVACRWPESWLSAFPSLPRSVLHQPREKAGVVLTVHAMVLRNPADVTVDETNWDLLAWQDSSLQLQSKLECLALEWSSLDESWPGSGGENAGFHLHMVWLLLDSEMLQATVEAQQIPMFSWFVSH